MIRDRFKSATRLTIRFYNEFLLFAFTAFLVLAVAGNVTAAEVTLNLSHSNTSQVSGYRIYYKIGQSGAPYDGTGISQGPSPVDIPISSVNDPMNAEFTLTGLQYGTDYFYSATVYDKDGNESPFSNEVLYTTAAAPTVYNIASSSEGNGTISPAGNLSVLEGENVTLAVAADEYHHIDDLMVDGVSVGAVSSYTFADVSSDHTISAVFLPDTFSITTTAGIGGTISPSMVQSIEYGQSMTYAISPNPGYLLMDVVVNGQSIGPVTSYTFANIDANQTISAQFEEDSILGAGDGSVPENVKIWLESEDGDIDSPMVIAADDKASGGTYAWVPNGNGNFFTQSGSGGRLQFTFEAPVAAEYVIWGRVIANSGNDDSFYVSVDGSKAIAWHTMQGGAETWTWDVVSVRIAGEEVVDTSQPNIYWLEAGTHTIEFSQREDGTKLDSILITNDLQYIPDGMGDQTEPVAQKIWLESEDGNIDYPMVIAADDRASGGGYAWVPNGNGNYFTQSGIGGRLQFTFEAPVAADYVIWGRVIANSGNDDSFYVSVDGSKAIAWHTMQGGAETWTWDVVSVRKAGEEVVDTSHPNIYWLEAGTHTIEFSQREDGTKLDSILITNDLQYIPDGMGDQTEPVAHKIRLEAEDGDIGYPMVIATDDKASGGTYAWVPNGNGNFFNQSGSGGRLQFKFEAPVAAEYVIWGRVIANSGNDDSFYVSVDGSKAIAWHTMQGGAETWTWDVVSVRKAGEEVVDTSHPNIYWLEAGTHTIEFSQREDGIKLDSILITNDLQYMPGR